MAKLINLDYILIVLATHSRVVSRHSDLSLVESIQSNGAAYVVTRICDLCTGHKYGYSRKCETHPFLLAYSRGLVKVFTSHKNSNSVPFEMGIRPERTDEKSISQINSLH